MNNSITLHPGQILNNHYLIPKQISINTFSTQTGITENYIKDLISGRQCPLKGDVYDFMLFFNTFLYKIEFFREYHKSIDVPNNYSSKRKNLFELLFPNN